MKRYAIWDKVTPIITPIGEVLSPEQWKERYPVAALDSITVVCAAGEINGAFFGTLGQMKQMYEANGADFSACVTPEDCLKVIEDFEDEMNKPDPNPTPEERLAAAIEFQNLMNM